MILLIDIGNSRTKYVYLINNKLSSTTQLNNDEFSAAYFVKYFSHASQIIVANVAKSTLTDELAAWCVSQKISFKQVHSEPVSYTHLTLPTNREV